MYYRREKDAADYAAGCFWSIIGFFFSLLGFFGIYLYNQHRNAPGFPTTLEPRTAQRPMLYRLADLFLGFAILILMVAGAVVAFAENGLGDSPGVLFILVVACFAASAVFRFFGKRKLANEFWEQQAATPAYTPQRYEIALPPGMKWQPQVSIRLVEHLLRSTEHLALRIVAEYNRTWWEILDWRSDEPPEYIIQAIHSYYPDAEVKHEEVSETPVEYPFYRYIIFFRQAADFVWPITSATELKEFDPLVALTQGMSDLKPGERAIYTLALSIHADYAQKAGEKLITRSRIHPLQAMSPWGRSHAVADLIYGTTRDEKYQQRDQRVARAKLSHPLYQCFLAAQIDSPDKDRMYQLAAQMDSPVWQFTRPPYNGLIWDPEPWPESIRHIQGPAGDKRYTPTRQIMNWVMGIGERWKTTRLIMSAEEAASLWHLPHEQFTSRNILWGATRQVAAPVSVTENHQGVLLGTNTHGGRDHPVVIPYPDRNMHVYITGKTGVGKSTLMHHMIHQDIEAGKGVAVIDPHGNLVRSILRSSIPPEREDDVVLMDFAQTDYPPPLNPFYVPEGVPRDTAISHILAVLKKIYEDDWSKTRMESAIYSALVALLYEDHATPRDISRIFLDAEYRTGLLQKVKDPVALEYWWDEFGQMSEGRQGQVREPVLNRIRIFYRNAAVRNMVCHPHKLDFRGMMEEGKIFLANLNSRETHSEQSNLGAMLITNFQLAAMSRPPVEEEHREPYYLYVDELQQFVTTSMPTVFSEARKFGLSLTAANQFLGQLKGSTLDAIMGNAGASVVFASGPEDARTLAPLLQPQFSSEDIVNFDRFHAAVKLQVNRKTMSAFSLQTQPPIPVADDSEEREARIRQKSIQNYTPWSRQEVEAWYEQRYQRRPVPRPTGEVTDYD